VESLMEKEVDEFGNIRNDEQGYMNGADVFSFVIREIPQDIKKTTEYAGINIEDLDYIVFHQANQFMNDYLVKKIKLDKNKIPATISKYGNTSSVSVPLTIVSELRGKLNGTNKVMLSAFGVGMTWASAILDFNDCKISHVIEL